MHQIRMLFPFNRSYSIFVHVDCEDRASLYLLCINIQVELLIEKVQEAGKNYERLIKENTEREKRRVEMIKERHEDLEQHIETVKTTVEDVSIYTINES